MSQTATRENMDVSNASLDISAEIDIEPDCVKRCPDQACGYTTKNKSNLNKHVKRMHPLPMTSTPIKASSDHLTYVFDKCGKTYKSPFGLNLHVKNKHTKDFKYKCEICSKGFNQRIQFRFHLSSHSSVGIDVCKFCKADFQSSGSLSRHLESCLQKPKPYACDICQEKFYRKYKRDEHKRGKHGEKRYSCKGCGKRFGWRSSLKVHGTRCALLTETSPHLAPVDL